MPLSTVFVQKHGKPLYQQLYDQIRRDIEAGHLQAGEKLPSKRVLCRQIGISQNTVETAYEQLLVEGYLESVPRSGYFVGDVRPMTPWQAPATAAAVGLMERQPYAYDLSTSTVDTTQFPFATWARLTRRVIREEHQRLLDCTLPQGDAGLRQTLATFLRAYRAVHCQPEQIVIGAGTEYLLGLLVQILGRDAHYGVEDPGSAKTRQILLSHGSQAQPIAVDDQGMSIEAIRRAAVDRIYITPSHQFPLGMVMPVGRRHELLKWVLERKDRYIIEDDYDSEFRFTGRPVPSLQGLDRTGRTVYLGTFSKSIAPSIRISYMVLPPALLERYRRHFSFYASTVSHFEQKVLGLFLREGYFERHLNKMRKLYHQRQLEWALAIQSWPFHGQIHLGGLDAGLHLRLVFPEDLCETDLIRKAARQGVKVYGLQEYVWGDRAAKRPPTIIVGYAHLDSEALAKVAARLRDAWQPCFAKEGKS